MDIADKIKQKGNLDYLPWSTAWAKLKEADPTASYEVHKNEFGRFWFDDGKSAWCEVTVRALQMEHTQILPIMDFKNKALPADKVDSMEANKCMQRCLTKAIAALSGIGLKIYEGEDTSPSKSTRGRRASNKTPVQSSTSPELQEKQKEIILLAKKLIGSGIERDLIYKTIADNNGGNKQPNSIKTIELAQTILDKLKELTN